MAYLDPNTILNPSPGVPLPAALLDQYRDNFEWIVRGKPRVYGNLDNTTCPNVTTTALNCSTEGYDIGGMHSGSSSQFVISDDGFYQPKSYVVFEPNATGIRRVLVKVNGVTVIADDSKNAPTLGAAHFSFSGPTPFLSAGDYVEVQAYQDSGGSLDVTGGIFSLEMVALV